MQINAQNYVPAAIMFNRAIREMRDHVEFEKYLCRTIKDNDITREFKLNTDMHPESKYSYMYNRKSADEKTIAGKKASKDANTE